MLDSKSVVWIKGLIIIIVSITFLINTYGHNLSVSTLQIDDQIEYEYIFDFSSKVSNTVIAFEKPQDAEFLVAKDNQDNLYTPIEVGDFYRFELDSREIVSFRVKFGSKESLKKIIIDNEQYFYINTNQDLKFLEVNIDTVRVPDDVLDVFPREYIIDYEKNQISFQIDSTLNDNLFQIKYSKSNSEISPWLLGLLFVPVFFFLILFIILKVKPAKNEENQKNLQDYIEDEDEKKDNKSYDELKDSKIVYKKSLKDLRTDSKMKIEDSNDNCKEKFDKEIKEVNSTQETEFNYVIDNHELEEDIVVSTENKIPENKSSNIKTEDKNNNLNVESDAYEKIEEYIVKYLTLNEQDVIRVIQKNEGIRQQEILDILPIMTKSTLSKIITKLEGKKILERVRVGKINKLYLGEILKELIKTDPSSESQ